MILRVTLFLIAMSTLAITHYVATINFLYWRYTWLDIPMHFLGGLCVALGFSILPFFRITLPERYRTLIWYLLMVFAVGIAWEVFEYINGISLASPHERLLTDTLGDLFFDLLGGYTGYFISRHTSEHYDLN